MLPYTKPKKTTPVKRKVYQDPQDILVVKRKVLEDYIPCNLCSKVFTNTSDLKEHELEHNKDVVQPAKERDESSDESESEDYFKRREGSLNKKRGDFRRRRLPTPDNERLEMEEISSEDDAFSSSGVDDDNNDSTYQKRKSSSQDGHRGRDRVIIKYDHRRKQIHTNDIAISFDDDATSRKRKEKTKAVHTDGKHHSDDEEECTICNKFTKKYGAELHKRMHEKPYHCTFCDESFTLMDGLLAHEREKHKGKIPLACNQCGKLFQHKFSFINHLKSHTGEWPFECRLCGKRYSSKPSLKMHEYEHSRSELPFQCDQCEKGFRTTDALNGHMFIHNTNNASHVIDEIKPTTLKRAQERMKYRPPAKSKPPPYREDFPNDDAFPEPVSKNESYDNGIYDDGSQGNYSQYDENDENFTHISAKEFWCRRCYIKFPSKGQLIEHNHANHQEGKTYYCDHCGEKFWRKRRLTRHTNMHCPILLKNKNLPKDKQFPNMNRTNSRF